MAEALPDLIEGQGRRDRGLRGAEAHELAGSSTPPQVRAGPTTRFRDLAFAPGRSTTSALARSSRTSARQAAEARPASPRPTDGRRPQDGSPSSREQATFLFVTREGTTGTLELNGLVTDFPVRTRSECRLRPPDPPEQPGKPAPLPSVHGAYRGVQFTFKFLYTEEDGAR